MKKLIFSLIILMSLTVKANDGVQFEAKDAHQPLSVRIVSSFGPRSLYDSSERERVIRRVIRSFYDSGERERVIIGYLECKKTSGCKESYYYYRYRMLSGEYSPEIKVDEKTCNNLLIYFASATEACPVDVEIDRNTFKILKVTSACDPLANTNETEFLNGAI